jgi:WD40 repeat protein
LLIRRRQAWLSRLPVLQRVEQCVGRIATDGTLRTFEVSADGRWLADVSSGSGSVVRLRQVHAASADGTTALMLRGHQADVTQARMVASSCRSLLSRSVSMDRLVCRQVTWSADMRFVLSCSRDATLRVWHADTGVTHVSSRTVLGRLCPRLPLAICLFRR